MNEKIFLHTFRGLAFLHHNGVVHSDMQPGNQLFSRVDFEDMEGDAPTQG
jgi:serine/threonine protein kinase